MIATHTFPVKSETLKISDHQVCEIAVRLEFSDNQSVTFMMQTLPDSHQVRQSRFITKGSTATI
ncbi:MAG TPA: hypothetical protein DIW81_08615 [Planctomycetaceae bacterium]|nr:hypothetical protein [Planctomycetaceae bacterium]